LTFQQPKFDTLTPEIFLQRFKDRCIEVSAGRLSDFSDASTLQVLGEAIALVANDLLVELNTIFPQAIAASLGLMGATRKVGATAVASARFQLEAVFSQGFPIPRGHRFSLGAKVFQTQYDLLIPANLDTANPANYPLCTVSAIALEFGADGNQPPQQAIILQPIPGLLGIHLDEPAIGGQDEETLDEFSDRIFTRIANSIGEPSTAPIIQASEFEQAAVEQLGQGAIVMAVPELGANQASKEIAAMHLFVRNADGAAITAAQQRSLSEALTPRAVLAQGRLYFSPLNVAIVNINVSCRIEVSVSLDAVAAAINSALRSTFTEQTTIAMASLDLYRAINVIYLVAGVVAAIVQWGLTGDQKQASAIQLPRLAIGTSRTTPAKIGEITINFQPSNITRTFTS
jgi:uncharacterized phage protein gp47/JayE